MPSATARVTGEPPRDGPSMGSPIVATPAERGTLTARWDAETQRMQCVGNATPLRPSTQSPMEPTSAMIVRAFLPAEHGVVACVPPTTPNGRLPLRGLFHGTGLPDEYAFPGIRLTARQARCLGAPLCAVRMPAFRSPNATVQYEVLVAVPE